MTRVQTRNFRPKIAKPHRHVFARASKEKLLRLDPDVVEQEAVVRDGHRHGELVKVVLPAVRNKNICVRYLNEILSTASLSLSGDEWNGGMLRQRGTKT